MIALLLALGSSLAYGCADFLGGLGARKAHVLRTVMIAAPASLVVELLLWPVLGASFGVGALGWGAASGVASAAAFVLLYRTLAIGPMNVLSPVTALVSAALPVGVGLLQGEHLGPVVWITPQTRGLARTSAALSSVADSPTLGFARAGGAPIASTPSSALQLHAPDPAHRR